MLIRDINYVVHQVGDEYVQFAASDLDEAAATKYYGFLSADGKWFIQEVTATTIRYAKGEAHYSDVAWPGRALLSYDYYDVVF